MEDERGRQMTRRSALDVHLSRRENAKLLRPSLRPRNHANAALTGTVHNGSGSGDDWSLQLKFHARSSSPDHSNSAHQTSPPTENETAVGGPRRPKIYSFEHWCLFRGRDGYEGICVAAAPVSRGRPLGQTFREAAFARLLCTRFCICDRSELVGMENGAIRKMAQGLVAAASVFNYGQHNWLLAYENARKQALSASSQAGHFWRR